MPVTPSGRDAALQRLLPIARGNRMRCFEPIAIIAAFGIAPFD
jgi:hypothetical protein